MTLIKGIVLVFDTKWRLKQEILGNKIVLRKSFLVALILLFIIFQAQKMLTEFATNNEESSHAVVSGILKYIWETHLFCQLIPFSINFFYWNYVGNYVGKLLGS